MGQFKVHVFDKANANLFCKSTMIRGGVESNMFQNHYQQFFENSVSNQRNVQFMFIFKRLLWAWNWAHLNTLFHFLISYFLGVSFEPSRALENPTFQRKFVKLKYPSSFISNWNTLYEGCKGRTNLEMGKQTLSCDNSVGWANSWATKNKATEKMLSLISGRTHSLFTEL